MVMRAVRISKEEAKEKYGIVINGANSTNRYYLREDGCVIDDTGCVRYCPPPRVTEQEG